MSIGFMPKEHYYMQRERRARFWSMLFGLALAAGEVIKYWDVNRVRRLDFNIY